VRGGESPADPPARHPPRASAAILRAGERGPEILLVRYREQWVLPGGRLGPGEDAAAGAVREVLEETGLRVTVRRRLYRVRFPARWDTGFWCEAADPAAARLGTDPERPPDGQHLTDLRWFPLAAVADHFQIVHVLAALRAAAASAATALPTSLRRFLATPPDGPPAPDRG
jgi:8-oxo-dGTP pyrophosphatase MutT (NUDIX family)